jgi:hypothetical protein
MEDVSRMQEGDDGAAQGTVIAERPAVGICLLAAVQKGESPCSAYGGKYKI